MNLQITFLERCKALGLADKNLPAWLDEIESLHTQIAAQAAQIEMMRNELILMKRDKWHWQEARDRALSTTPSQALADFAAKVRNEAYEKAAVFCDLQQDEPECPERASYCAEAIRNLKELP